MIRIEENNKMIGGKVLITEKSLNRLLGKHFNDGFVIMSACREKYYKDGSYVDYNDTDGKWYLVQNKKVTNIECTENDFLDDTKRDALNNKKTEELKKDIINSGYSFLPVYGGYPEDGTNDDDKEYVYEKSFVIFCFDRKGNPIDIKNVIKDCKKWCVDYWQDSILINDGESNPYYWERKTNSKGMEFSSDISKWKVNDLIQDYFTALKPYKKGVGSPQRFSMEMYTNVQPSSPYYEMKRVSEGEICKRLSRWEYCIENDLI